MNWRFGKQDKKLKLSNNDNLHERHSFTDTVCEIFKNKKHTKPVKVSIFSKFLQMYKSIKNI